MKILWPFRLDSWPRWLRDSLPLLLWLALIFYLSSQSTLLDINNKTGEKITFKTAHVITYAILTWLWWRFLSPTRRPAWPVLAVALSLTILYAISDEIHQAFVPGRHARLADVLFDTSGGLLTLFLLRRLEWLRDFPEKMSRLYPAQSGNTQS